MFLRVLCGYGFWPSALRRCRPPRRPRISAGWGSHRSLIFSCQRSVPIASGAKYVFNSPIPFAAIMIISANQCDQRSSAVSFCLDLRFQSPDYQITQLPNLDLGPPPVIHPTRSQSSQFGVGFRTKDFSVLYLNVPLCSFVSFVVNGLLLFNLPITRFPDYPIFG